jgi:hypothetical protein
MATPDIEGKQYATELTIIELKQLVREACKAAIAEQRHFDLHPAYPNYPKPGQL